MLQTLRGFRDGGSSSERQWSDILGVLALQRGALDEVYMDAWADRLSLRDLLDRARREAP